MIIRVRVLVWRIDLQLVTIKRSICLLLVLDNITWCIILVLVLHIVLHFVLLLSVHHIHSVLVAELLMLYLYDGLNIG